MRSDEAHLAEVDAEVARAGSYGGRGEAFAPATPVPFVLGKSSTFLRLASLD